MQHYFRGYSLDGRADGDNGNANKVAELVSLPLSEDVKLTLKISQNMHADNYLSLIAVHGGSKNSYEGLAIEGRFLNASGIDLRSISLGDSEGGVRTEVIGPAAAIHLLDRVMRSDDSGPPLTFC